MQARTSAAQETVATLGSKGLLGREGAQKRWGRVRERDLRRGGEIDRERERETLKEGERDGALH